MELGFLDLVLALKVRLGPVFCGNAGNVFREARNGTDAC